MILSIQSNVMHGYVGNRACLPFYQAFGIESEHLDTVRLAAHPGHGTSARDILDGAVMTALFDDYLALPDRVAPEAIHIGYFGALDQIAPTAQLVKTLKVRESTRMSWTSRGEIMRRLLTECGLPFPLELPRATQFRVFLLGGRRGR